ncbi:MAG TPA: helix-turn-helix domain-containing protein [Solirubrobacteraceae bacterium]|jgi:AcrR family transcriptional regulator|nr:helix-turn-helix domain-containing protein [Solirubrobacteraceae bacterium]
MDTIATKPALRADARRNHEKIIEGAREVFARYGASAQMEDIARASGVGVGTVYRHFPTKEALMTELVRRTFESFVENGRAALATDADPFELLAGVLRKNCELIAGDAAVQQAITGGGEEVWAGTEREREELAHIAHELIKRAQRGATVRADVGPDDIPMLMCGICATMSHKAKMFDWRRHLELALDGLRAR